MNGVLGMMEVLERQGIDDVQRQTLATMSHEIRTPMNGVLGMMEVLDRQGLDAGQRRTVATMRDSAQALVQDGAEYLREESRDLVAPAEIDAFLDDVDALRERAERLEARVQRLALRARGDAA